MHTKIELKRKWYEKLVWPLGLAFTLFWSALNLVIKQSSFIEMWIWLFIFVPFWSWGTWINITKPNALISDDKLYLFRRFLPKPTSLLINEIQSVKRQSTFPVWRVPPLVFYLKNGNMIKFSTGGDENKMKRIISFLEKETPLKIKYS